MNDKCYLCPRQCGAERNNFRGNGYCKMGKLPVIARADLHKWEEPCISGKNGSGTVFFTGCTLSCVFCQNYEISNLRNTGKILTPKQLSDVFFELIERGAHNINLVSPTPFVPAIIEALSIKKLPVPVVYNTSGYETIETIKSLNGLVQIYLPDFKYIEPELARNLSNAENYVDYAQSAIKEMIKQTGKCVFENNMIKSGTIIRHLILPGHIKNSIHVLDWIKSEFNTDCLVSIMAQYIPCGKAKNIEGLNRTITKREYNKVLNHLFEINLDGFVQERSSAKKEYIPNFDFDKKEKYKSLPDYK